MCVPTAAVTRSADGTSSTTRRRLRPDAHTLRQSGSTGSSRWPCQRTGQYACLLIHTGAGCPTSGPPTAVRPPTGARSQKRDIGPSPYVRKGFLIILMMRRRPGVTCAPDLRPSWAAPREEPLATRIGPSALVPIDTRFRVPNPILFQLLL